MTKNFLHRTEVASLLSRPSTVVLLASVLTLGCKSTLLAGSSAGPAMITAAASVTKGGTIRASVAVVPPAVTYDKTDKRLRFDETAIRFAFDSDRLVGHDTYKILTGIRDFLRDHPTATKLRVEGHTDSQGNDDYNLALSKRRAGSVVAWLVANGCPRA